MFPENVVAFGGRLMEAAKNSPKVLNSPAKRRFYAKHATLFNLNNAKNATDKQPLIVVEWLIWT
jgi:DNA primase